MSGHVDPMDDGCGACLSYARALRTRDDAITDLMDKNADLTRKLAEAEKTIEDMLFNLGIIRDGTPGVGPETLCMATRQAIDLLQAEVKELRERCKKAEADEARADLHQRFLARGESIQSLQQDLATLRERYEKLERASEVKIVRGDSEGLRDLIDDLAIEARASLTPPAQGESE